MINIKKAHESKIMDFKSFLNENEKEYNYNQLFAEKTIDELVTGKLKPIQVSPKDSKDQTKFSFTEADDKEGADVNEEAEIYLQNEESLFINFSWSYSYEAGRPSSNYDQPDDDGEFILESLEIDTVYYYFNKGHDELEVTITPEIESKLKTYFEQFIEVSGVSSSYQREQKKRTV